MVKILTYHKFSKDLCESFPKTYSDPMYGNDVFRIRYRQINDLSNKRSNDTKPVPINDLLDGFGIGDVVRGKCISDGKYYDGKILSIGKDEEGENITIKIEHEGEVHKLTPSTVSFVEGGDIGNRNPINTNTPDNIDITGNQVFIPTTYESKSESKI